LGTNCYLNSLIAAENCIINLILFMYSIFSVWFDALVQLFTVLVFVAIIVNHFNRSYNYKIFHARIHVRDLSRFIKSLPVMEVSIQGRVPLPVTCTKLLTKGSLKGGDKVGISSLNLWHTDRLFDTPIFLLLNDCSSLVQAKHKSS